MNLLLALAGTCLAALGLLVLVFLSCMILMGLSVAKDAWQVFITNSYDLMGSKFEDKGINYGVSVSVRELCRELKRRR